MPGWNYEFWILKSQKAQDDNSGKQLPSDES